MLFALILGIMLGIAGFGLIREQVSILSQLRHRRQDEDRLREL